MSLGLSYAVITACLNSARTIERCVGSVLCQGTPPKQYVFVDGGSTDGTIEIIRRTLAAHPELNGAVEVTMLDQGGAGGISAAWNMALERCTSDVVFILNGDDWYERDCAETVLAAMNADKQVDIVVANARNYKRGEKVPCGVWRNRPAWLLPILMPYVHPACFVRKCVYDRVGGFDPEYLTAMDYDFLWRCRAGGMRFTILPDIVTNFELGGTANSCRKEARVEVYRIGRRYCRLLPMAALAARFLTGR